MFVAHIYTQIYFVYGLKYS